MWLCLKLSRFFIWQSLWQYIVGWIPSFLFTSGVFVSTSITFPFSTSSQAMLETILSFFLEYGYMVLLVYFLHLNFVWDVINYSLLLLSSFKEASVEASTLEPGRACAHFPGVFAPVTDLLWRRWQSKWFPN